LKFIVFDHENSGWPRRRPETLDHPLQPLAIDRFSEVASGTKLSGAPALVQDGHQITRISASLRVIPAPRFEPTYAALPKLFRNLLAGHAAQSDL
jgi:hypothetical protein